MTGLIRLLWVSSLLSLAVVQQAGAVDIEYVWKIPRIHIPRDVAPVENPVYLKECGACHFAYQPGFLPARSWQALTQRLADHFGDNAELPGPVTQQILKYMMANAADRVEEKGSVRIMQRMRPDETPLRLTDTAYLKLRHRNVLPRFIKGNPRIRGFSDCSACHTTAAGGFFNERDVKIPGFSRPME